MNTLATPVPAAPALDPRLAAVLVCPKCRKDLESMSDPVPALRCADCSVEYPIMHGVPVLLHPVARARFKADRAAWTAGTIRPPGDSWRTLFRLAAPKPHRWSGEAEAVRALCASAPAGAAIVDIGCGSDQVPEGVWRLDIGPDPGTHLSGDAHALPFADASLDGLFIFRVLEHVTHPEAVVAEIHRVLRPGGFVAAVVPFLEPYHRDPIDHARYCREGVARLFVAFEQRELRWVAGPGAAVAWMLKEYLAICFPFSNRPLVYAAVREIAGWLLTPLRWTDALLTGKTFAHKIACEFFYVGTRKA